MEWIKAEGSRVNKFITGGINVFLSPGWYFSFLYCLASVCNMYRKWMIISPVETGTHKMNRRLIIM